MVTISLIVQNIISPSFTNLYNRPLINQLIKLFVSLTLSKSLFSRETILSFGGIGLIMVYVLHGLIYSGV